MNPKDRKDTSFLNFSSWTFGRRFCSNQRPCPWWVWEWMILFSALFSSKLLLVRGGKNYIDIRNFIQSRHDYSSFIHGIFNSWPWKILPPDASTKFFRSNWSNGKTWKRVPAMLKCWKDVGCKHSQLEWTFRHSMTIPKWCRSDGHWTWRFPTWKPKSWLGKIGVATSPGDSVGDPRTAVCEL